MINLTLLSAYSLSVLLLLVTPGPVVALVTGTAARHGARKAFVTVIGTNSASLVLIILAALMLAGVVSISGLFLSLLGIAGSLYIGYGALISLRAGNPQANAQENTVAAGDGGVIRGFITGISNPKDILFFVAFFPQFIAVTQNFAASIMTLTVVWIIFDFAVLSLYILLINNWLSPHHSRRIGLASSLFLLVISLSGLVYNVREIIHHLPYG